MNDESGARGRTLFECRGNGGKKIIKIHRPSRDRGRRFDRPPGRNANAYRPFRRVDFGPFGLPRWPTGIMCAAKIPFATTRRATRTHSLANAITVECGLERERTTGACLPVYVHLSGRRWRWGTASTAAERRRTVRRRRRRRRRRRNHGESRARHRCRTSIDTRGNSDPSRHTGPVFRNRFTGLVGSTPPHGGGPSKCDNGKNA